MKRKSDEQQYNPYLKAAILDVVENQLRENNPPETRQTLNRLIQAGYSEDRAREMIGTVITTEIYYVMKDNEPFNNERFVSGLNNLK